MRRADISSEPTPHVRLDRMGAGIVGVEDMAQDGLGIAGRTLLEIPLKEVDGLVRGMHIVFREPRRRNQEKRVCAAVVHPQEQAVHDVAEGFPRPTLDHRSCGGQYLVVGLRGRRKRRGRERRGGGASGSGEGPLGCGISCEGGSSGTAAGWRER